MKWSDGFVIQPGQFYAVRVPKPGERSEIMGITGNGEGFVIVRFRDAKLGGFRTLCLTATNPRISSSSRIGSPSRIPTASSTWCNNRVSRRRRLRRRACRSKRR